MRVFGLNEKRAVGYGKPVGQALRSVRAVLPAIGEEDAVEILDARRDLGLAALGAYEARLDHDKLVSPRGRAVVYGQTRGDCDARVEVHDSLAGERGR